MKTIATHSQAFLSKVVSRGRKLASCVALLFCTCVALPSLQADGLLYWAPGGTGAPGGPGTWDGASSQWNDASNAMGTQQVWGGASYDAFFGGSTSGAVAVSSGLTAASLNFQTAGYTLTGADITIQSAAGSKVFVAASNTTGDIMINNNLLVNITSDSGTSGARYRVQNESSGTLTLNGNITLTASTVLTGGRSIDLDASNASGGTIVVNGSFANTSAASVAVRFGENMGRSTSVYKLNGTSASGISKFNITTGTVLVGNAAALGSADINLGSGGTDSTAALLTDGSMTVANNVTIGGNGSKTATYVIGGNTADVSTFSGNIYGNDDMPLTLRAAAGGVVNFTGTVRPGASTFSTTTTKDGLGTVRLTGNNEKSSTWVVAAGTLLANSAGYSTGNGSVIVQSGGTLGGTGHVYATAATTSSITVQSGGVLMGGEGVDASGTLTLDGNVIMDSGSEISLTLGAGLTHSTIALNSGLWTFDANQSFDFTLLSGATTGTYTDILIGVNVDPGTLSSWQILTSTVRGTFVYDSANQGISLIVTQVPEPGAMTLVLIGGGVTLLLGLRRKRA